jgi:hypothetical protein
MFNSMGYRCPGLRVGLVPFPRHDPMRRSQRRHQRLHPYDGLMPARPYDILRMLEPTPADPLDVDITRATMARVYLRW